MANSADREPLFPAAAASGFTIMELMLVVAIFGLLMTATGMALHNISRADLRSAASRTASAMRHAFDRSTMTGTYVRLVFNIGRSEVFAEVSEERVSLTAGRGLDEDEGRDHDEDAKFVENARRARERHEARRKMSGSSPLSFFLAPAGGASGVGGGEGEPDDADELFDEVPGIDAETLVAEYEMDLRPVTRTPPKFKPLKSIVAKKIKLPKGIRILAVTTPRMADPITQGRAHVYFFPQGHSEPAIVYLANRAEEIYSVVLHPMTGQARIYSCEYPIPSDFGASDDSRRRKSSGRCAEEHRR